jgi:hypothetical protein
VMRNSMTGAGADDRRDVAGARSDARGRRHPAVHFAVKITRPPMLQINNSVSLGRC